MDVRGLTISGVSGELAEFTDGSEGIFRATVVPAPAAHLLLASALIDLGLMGWKRSKRV